MPSQLRACVTFRDVSRTGELGSLVFMTTPLELSQIRGNALFEKLSSNI